MYLNKGSLPWDEIERIPTTRSVCDMEHPDNIIRKDKKSIYSLSPFINGKLSNYMNYCYSLKFDDMPNYQSLMLIFT